MRIVSLDSPLIKEAFYDMCKNLISISVNSISILEINFKFIEHNIQKGVDYDLFFHWLYLMRIFDLEKSPEAMKVVKEFFHVYSDSLLHSGLNQKFSVLVCDILQEYLLADLIPYSDSNITIPSILQYCIESWTELNKINVEGHNSLDSNLMERKEHIVKILICIFMKYIEDPQNPMRGELLSIFEKAFMVGMEEVISENYDPSMQHLSSYITQLLVLMNRGIIMFEEVRNNIFNSQDQSQSSIFLEKWFDKMSFIMLNYARRINQLAIIHTLPFMNKEMIAFAFPKIAPLVFSAVESYIYIKENKNEADFYSPEKIEGYETVSMVRNVNAKGSKRLATLRSNDSLMNANLAEIFIKNLQKM